MSIHDSTLPVFTSSQRCRNYNWFRRGCTAQNTAVVSLNEPHKFLYISENLCNLFDFAPEQLLGRSVKILQGPSTNTIIFDASIKNARLQQSCTVPLTTYRRDGSECNVDIAFCANVGGDGMVDGVKLTFSPCGDRSFSTKASVDGESSSRSFRNHTQSPTEHSTQAPEPGEPFSLAARNLRGSARARYNRTIGRELAVEG